MPIELNKFLDELEGSNLQDDPYSVAEQKGLKVVLPRSNELFLDIDSEEDLDKVKRLRGVLFQNGIVHAVPAPTPSRTPGHYHVVVSLDRDVTDIERIALQAILGSDPKRELLSLLRIWFKTERPPTVFFEEAA